MITANAKIQYLRTSLCGEALNEFNTFCIQIVSTTVTHLNEVILDLGKYFPPETDLSKKIVQCATDWGRQEN